MMATRIRVRKSPRQERSKVMVEAILEAASQVFAELGYARSTTNKIAERAGVSVGSLYQYFPNKDSLMANLHRDHQTKIHRVVEKALRRFGDHSVSLEDGLGLLLDELNQVHEDNPTLTKALSREAMLESEVGDRVHDDREDTEKLNQLFTLLFDRPDVRGDNHTIIAVITGQVISYLTRWLQHDAPSDLDKGTLREETILLLVRYLKK